MGRGADGYGDGKVPAAVSALYGVVCPLYTPGKEGKVKKRWLGRRGYSGVAKIVRCQFQRYSFPLPRAGKEGGVEKKVNGEQNRYSRSHHLFAVCVCVFVCVLSLPSLPLLSSHG